MSVSFLRFDDLEVKKEIFNMLRTIEHWIEAWEENNTHPSEEGNSSE